MSISPLSGIKLLDLSPDPGGSPPVRALCGWGAERIALPPGLDTTHPEGKRILLLLVQEVDVLIGPPAGLPDLGMLQEYNPMLISCVHDAQAEPWAAATGILVALWDRSHTGLGQQVRVSAGAAPAFSSVIPQPVPTDDPDHVLSRLGYDAAALRRAGILRTP